MNGEYELGDCVMILDGSGRAGKVMIRFTNPGDYYYVCGAQYPGWLLAPCPNHGSR